MRSTRTTTSTACTSRWRSAALTLAGLAGCGPAPCVEHVPVSDLRVTVDAQVPTLVHVRWTSDAASLGAVLWTPDGRDAVRVDDPAGVGTDHAVDLLGIPAGATAALTVANLGDDGAPLGQTEAEVTLDAAPDALASLRAVQPLDPEVTPYLMVTSVEASTGLTSIQVVDGQGRPVWWVPPASDLSGFARPRRDGGGVVYLGSAVVDGASGAVLRTDWDGTTTLWSAPDVHHDLYELDDGAVVASGWDERTVDGQRIAGERLLRVGPGGVEGVIWNSFDALATTSNACWGVVRTPDGATDAVHVNGLDHDDARDRWLVSSYCLDTVFAIDGATGATIWAAGGDAGTLTLRGDGGFGPQHAPRFVDAGFRLYDNGRDVAAGSQVETWAVDEAAGTATRVAVWAPPDGGYSAVLGAAEPLGEGMLVSTGLDGAVYATDAAGAVIGAWTLPEGHVASSVAALPAFGVGDARTGG